MHKFTITIPGYSTWAQAVLSIAVIEDQNLSLNPQFQQLYQPGTAFEFRCDHAIQSADRHLFIRGRPPKPLKVVEAWLHLLRWEFSTFWAVDQGTNTIDSRGAAFSSEHPTRAGEMFAEGLAVLLMEKRLRLPRSKLFFYSSPTARPDFLFTPSRRIKRALLLGDRRAFGLEARLRAGWASIRKEDHAGLAAKKQGGRFSGVLAVYLGYGPPSLINGTSRTRLILGDPERDAPELTEADARAVVLGHYYRACQRLGLWEFCDHLEAAIGREGEQPLDRQPNIDAIPGRVSFAGSHYRGSFLSELLTDVQDETVDEAEVVARLATGNLGAIVFPWPERGGLGTHSRIQVART